MKILLLSAEPAHLEELRRALGGKNAPHEIGGAPLALLGNSADLLQEGADLLLVEARATDSAVWPQLERIVQAAPQLLVALISDDQSPDFLRLAMRAGVREVVEPGGGDVGRLVAQAEQQLARATTQGKGRVLAFLPTKGASGATFIATSVAYALSSRHHRKVLLIDLNLQLGDAAFFVSDQQPELTLADLCQQIHRLDASLLEASTRLVHPNFSVLASPDDPEKALLVKPDHVVRLLKVAAQHYDFVVLDVSRAMDAVSVAALDGADTIFPVLQQDLSYLRYASRLLKVFDALGYAGERIRPVLNRARKGEQIGVPEVEKSLGVRVRHVVPNNYHAVVSSVNQGVPLARLETAQHPVVLAINAMADEVAGVVSGAATREGGGWLRRVFQL